MDVEELIRCPKKIERKKRPKFREDFRHYRMDIELSCKLRYNKHIMSIVGKCTR